MFLHTASCPGRYNLETAWIVVNRHELAKYVSSIYIYIECTICQAWCVQMNQIRHWASVEIVFIIYVYKCA